MQNQCDNDQGSDYSELNLEPLTPLDLSQCDSISELLEGMSRTAFGGRCMGEALDVLQAMVEDEDCFVVMTLSGAMTVAKMGLVICDMIDRGWVNAIISTGALMAHGLIEGFGMPHFKYRKGMDDVQLHSLGLDRVYDTLETEENLNNLETYVKKVLNCYEPETPVCSHTFIRDTGRLLNETVADRAVAKSAYLRDVPVYIPAFSDSELGLDFSLFNRVRRMNGQKPLSYDPFLDWEDYASRAISAKKLGIFTIGGGVPRNWAQQLGPYTDIMEVRLQLGEPRKRFHYGVRVCPEPVHWGGLSGCTYSEGVSWGKFVPENEGGRFAEVMADATIAWPILVKALMERQQKQDRK
ncbi:MAG: deoxyhypusine synthase [Candidatus Wallbacteria bacterium HGW-Wallbacteria-1]|jgi:deoxyhypusine synthase|uniref:Deoxyhypusine synthase n=1 Tax=Candidatus Wallbacteria bacterium HGW-Wallbacteria-1 TaxID=2013854 RepID=A0A2N1PVI2_9BACT|nr:MAG: deoxyhypusine synthase [Candidatus Wallbacteria bacterium HGW-Wallbacteria-1]